MLILAISVTVLPLADPRFDPAAARGARVVHRQQSGARHHLLDDRDEPDAGDAARAVHPDAVVPAVRLHVSVSRDAGLGAMARRGVPDHPRAADRARHPAQGQRRHRDRCRNCGRSRPSRQRSRRSRCGSIARRWTEPAAAAASAGHPPAPARYGAPGRSNRRSRRRRRTMSPPLPPASACRPASW